MHSASPASLCCSSTSYPAAACSPLPWEKAGQQFTDRQTGLKEGHVLREKSCILGSLPKGNVSALR